MDRLYEWQRVGRQSTVWESIYLNVTEENDLQVTSTFIKGQCVEIASYQKDQATACLVVEDMGSKHQNVDANLKDTLDNTPGAVFSFGLHI